MARIRTIKPEFWTSEQIAECSPNARLLFIGMWNFADDAGILPAKTKPLKAKVFPYDPFNDDQLIAWVNELEINGLIVLYSSNGEGFWKITGWEKHQKIDKPSFKYPQPFAEDSPNPLRVVADPPPPEGKGRERKGDIPENFGISERVKIWAERKGHSNLEPHLENFIGQCKAKKYQYVDWDEAFMNAVRNNWAKVVPQLPRRNTV